MQEVNEKLSIVELQLNGLIRKLNEVVVINKRLEAENRKLKTERDNAISKLNGQQLSIFGAVQEEEITPTDLAALKKEVAQCMKDIDDCLAMLGYK